MNNRQLRKLFIQIYVIATILGIGLAVIIGQLAGIVSLIKQGMVQ